LRSHVFDPEQLVAVLRSARISASKKNVEDLDWRLTMRQTIYWIKQKEIIGVTGPSKELLDLHGALKRWLDLCFRDFRANPDDSNISTYELRVVVDEYEDDAEYEKKLREKILWMLTATKEAITLLDENKPLRPRHAKANSSYLFLQLYDDFCALSGKSTLSRAGPSIRFVTDCAKIIDPKIVVPLGLMQRIQSADAQRPSVKKAI
jgi:hypothetical protein